MSPLDMVQYSVKADQSPSPSPTQKDVATSPSSSDIPNPLRAFALPFDAGAPDNRRTMALLDEPGVLGSFGRFGVFMPYEVPLAGKTDPVEQKSVTWVGSSGSWRISYSRTRPSEVMTRRIESCSPQG